MQTATTPVPVLPRGKIKTFGAFGPKYEVGEPVRQLDDGDQAHFRRFAGTGRDAVCGGCHMKPGSKDKLYRILITGRELEELKRFTWLMAESFGLDRRIDNYKGKRSIGLYSWDLDCLVDVISLALNDSKEYPRKTGPSYEAMKILHDRLKQLSPSSRPHLTIH